jgi:hypothetical protein
VIKTLKAQVGQLLLGCKCPVGRFVPGRVKDLSAPHVKGWSRMNLAVFIRSSVMADTIFLSAQLSIFGRVRKIAKINY